MTSSTSAASAEALAPQTNNKERTPPAATAAEAPHKSMERSISHLEDVQAFDVADADLPPLPDASDDSFMRQDFNEDLVPSDGSDFLVGCT